MLGNSTFVGKRKQAAKVGNALMDFRSMLVGQCVRFPALANLGNSVRTRRVGAVWFKRGATSLDTRKISLQGDCDHLEVRSLVLTGPTGGICH